MIDPVLTVNLLDGLHEAIRKEDRWNVNETPDGHSRAWHGCWVLRNAREYVLTGAIDPNSYEVYTPIFTREAAMQ